MGRRIDDLRCDNYLISVRLIPKDIGDCKTRTTSNTFIEWKGLSMRRGMPQVDQREGVAVSHAKGSKHRFYEDAFHMLSRDGKAKALTREHQTDDGAIFRYFGIGDTFQMDVKLVSLEEGDRILLVSDGVTKYRAALEATNMIGNTPLLQNAVCDLVHQCQLAGETDDITAMLIEVEEFWLV
jgi:sulfur transfer complex TusBCD TusB component (DsrH family)